MVKGGVILVGFLALSFPLHGKDFGVQGATFKILEESMLAVIQNRLKALESSGKLEAHQKEIQGRVRHSLEHPLPVVGIQTVQSNRSWLYDPSLVMEGDIKDHQGNIIAARGTRVNPLDSRSFGKALLLIQGENERQVAWALRQGGKIVLVSGKPFQLAKTHRQPFFFDQGGIVCQKFGIQAVPARISQEGKMLLVEELAIREGGHP